jgi:transcriptional regulator with XRE-family HTH domain
MSDDVLDGVGPRLRALRQERGATLADLSTTTGISVSTLSRLESGQRRPTLEQLLPLARAHQVTLDELVDAPPRPATHACSCVPSCAMAGRSCR